jgi:hypothetical protein
LLVQPTIVTSTRALLLLLLLSSCKSGPAATPAREASAAEFYPLAAGNSWTYDVGSGRQEKIEIVGRDGPWFLDDHRGRFRYEKDGVRDADRYLLRTPLEAGAKWSAVDNLVVQRFEVISTDATAVTRAGTFTRCALVRNEQPLPKGGRFVTEWKYAPKVGLVELRTSVVAADGKSQDQTHLELVAFSLK